jgi:hypothetical protein
MPHLQFAPQPSLPPINNPLCLCSTCQMPMLLLHVEPDEKPDYDRRTLECVTCGRAELWVVKYE